MKIYLASSWRNPYYDDIFNWLSKEFPHTYNFKKDGFHWSDVLGSDWKQVSLEEYKTGLSHVEAEIGFERDKTALESASATVVVLPCGRSAHLELGVAIGLNQYTAIYSPEHFEPELMYKFCDLITDDVDELIENLQKYRKTQKPSEEGLSVEWEDSCLPPSS